MLKGVGGAALSPMGAVLAAYVPEARGVPGFVGLYDYRLLDKGGDPPLPISRKSFFRVRLLLVPEPPLVMSPHNNDTLSRGCACAAKNSRCLVMGRCARSWHI